MTKPIPNKLVKGPTQIHIHGNGPNRKRKVMVSTPQGMFSARRYFYKKYHPYWDGKGKIIHLNNDDLDFSKSNLILLSARECNNLVHFNNDFISSNKNHQKLAISLVKLRIAIKEVTDNEGRY
jgi:hypothetical protein